MTLSDFGKLLEGLTVGQQAELPYEIYELLFPPGEPDQDARMHAFDFAKSHGCRVEHHSLVAKVIFIREVTNPSR